ncbi:MAG: hypothetical protein GF392_01335 [Candidatus Omnitrophica bacterium]|nr:hypothetical protein [Candidatus Omnitrophota bacterium]
MRWLRQFFMIITVLSVLAGSAFALDLEGTWRSTSHSMGGKDMPFLAGRSVFVFKKGNRFEHDMGPVTEKGTYRIKGDSILFTLPGGEVRKAAVEGETFVVRNEMTDVEIVYEKKT